VNLFWNRTKRQLLAGLTNNTPVTAATLVLRDVEPMSIAAVTEQANISAPYLAGELGAGESILFGVKLTAAATGYLASQATWTLTGAGSSARYTADLDLNTVEMIAAMASATSLTCIAEVTLVRSDGEHAYSTQFALTVLKDVNVGTEGAPVSGNPPLASVAFVVSEVAQAVAPSGGSVRIHAGQLQVWNDTKGAWRAVWLTGDADEHFAIGEAAT
jgi:hypothetical protein